MTRVLRSVSAWVACLLGVVGMRGVTHAQDSAALPATVSLSQDACVSALYDQKSLASLLTMELRAIGVEQVSQVSIEADAAKNASPGLALVSMGCATTPDIALLRVADFATRKRIEREMLLSDVKQGARPRAIAIAIVELLESSWTELVTRSGTPNVVLPEALAAKLRARLLPPTAANGAAASAPPNQAPSTRNNSLRLGLAERAFIARATGLLGVRLGYARVLWPNLKVTFDVELMRGGVDLQDTLGRVGHTDLNTVSGLLGLALVSSTQPSLSVGPLLNLGYALGHATSSRAGVTVKDSGDLIGSIGLQSRLDATLSAAWSLSVALDLGYMTAGADLLAGDARLAGLSNIALGVDAGAALHF